MTIVLTKNTSVSTGTITDTGLDTPTLTARTAPQSVYSGHTLAFSAAGAFSDPLHEKLTFKAVTATGAALPAWLTLNPITGALSGTAPIATQILTIQLTATNTNGRSASELVTIINNGVDRPKQIEQTAVQNVYGDHAVAFSAAGAFSDPLHETLTYKAFTGTGAALPAWLTVNPTTGAVSGTAPTSTQILAIQLIATNTDGGSASELVTITDNGLDTPRLTGQTAEQVVQSGHAFAFSAASTFADPNKEVLTYKATLISGAAPPSWITFNPTTLAFSGTAPSSFQPFSIKLAVTNTDGASNSETFRLVGDSPTLTTQTAPQTAYEGHAFSLAIPANTFADAGRETLTLTATQSNGQALPSWLSFNTTTRTFSGTAPKAASTTGVTLTATNMDGQSVSDTWMLTDRADSVALATQTANQTWNCGQTVSFAVPTGTFVDTAGETLTYAVTQANGAALPAGLSFNALTDKISGTAPLTPQMLGLKITATNTDGLASSETVMMFIKAAAPMVGTPTANHMLVDGHQLNLPLAGAFSDPQGSALTYAASEIVGGSAVSWLHLDNGVINGVAPSTGSGALGIRVTATDAYGLSASETFGLSYAPSGSLAPPALYGSTTPATEMLALHG